MSLFNQLGQATPQAKQQMTPEDQRRAMEADISRIKSGPAAFLQERGFRIPDGMNDAQQITSYLVQTGQIGAPRYQQAVRILSGIMRR